MLLKNAKKDLLVGAAYNLWKSLSGVKWLFEVRRLMTLKELQLSKIAVLDQEAIILNLND